MLGNCNHRRWSRHQEISILELICLKAAEAPSLIPQKSKRQSSSRRTLSRNKTKGGAHARPMSPSKTPAPYPKPQSLEECRRVCHVAVEGPGEVSTLQERGVARDAASQPMLGRDGDPENKNASGRAQKDTTADCTRGGAHTKWRRHTALCRATWHMTQDRFKTDSNRPQPLWQPPPTACVTASGAASEVPSVPIHSLGGGGWGLPSPCRPTPAHITKISLR